jgi:hypothetical protein
MVLFNIINNNEGTQLAHQNNKYYLKYLTLLSVTQQNFGNLSHR